MNFTWYKIFNRTEWLATGLVSRTLTLSLEDRGQEEFLITEGEETCVTYDGVLLPVEFSGKNPFVGLGDEYAVYVDEADDVYFGFVVEE